MSKYSFFGAAIGALLGLILIGILDMDWGWMETLAGNLIAISIFIGITLDYIQDNENIKLFSPFLAFSVNYIVICNFYKNLYGPDMILFIFLIGHGMTFFAAVIPATYLFGKSSISLASVIGCIISGGVSFAVVLIGLSERSAGPGKELLSESHLRIIESEIGSSPIATTPIFLVLLIAFSGYMISKPIGSRVEGWIRERERIRREEERRRLEYERRIRELKAKYEQYKREGYAPNKNLEEILK